MTFPVAAEEAGRLAVLEALGDLGSETASHLAAICRTAASLFDVPVALVPLVDRTELRPAAACGTGTEPIAREGAFCAHTIQSDDPLVIEDTLRDPRFADSPSVVGPAAIRFYAGAPLILAPGLRVGTLCVLDTRPRAFCEARRRQLQDLAGIVVGQLRLHEANIRQQQEIAAREASEARYRALADALPQLVWIFAVETGENAYVNQQFERYYGPIGASRAARLARNHPDDAERMNRAWRTAIRTRSPYQIEGRLRRHDGAYRWHRLVMIPIRQRGAMVAMLGTALDIDDIVTARRKLAETGKLLQLAQDSAGAGTWDLDLASGRITWSAESAKLHGIDAPRGHVLGTDEWLALVDRADGEAALAAAAAAAEQHTSFTIEFRVPQPGGSVRWVHGTGRAIYGADGAAQRVIGLNIDVTARKAAEDALMRAKAAAEAAQREAERASAAKSDFLATMSHEIRTPLNGVLGYAELLVDELEPGTVARLHAERIRGAGSSLLTVVTDVLDFSKIEAGQVDLAAEPFGLEAVTDEAVAIMRAAAELKGLHLAVEAGPDLPERVVGDADRLRQVLLNLLNNAVKFTAAGGVTLSVARLPGPASAGHLRFAVRDTGIGIPPEKHDHLFRRFSQMDGTIQREYGGTGLGLAISKQLVELMGGAIGLESALGAGSTFWFTLPMPVAGPAEQAAAPARRAEPSRSRHLLLVEDVPLNRELALAVLRDGGHRVDAVASGPEAIAAVQAGAYDLVLMDVQMPGMDGLAATRAIRALAHPCAAVPIIAMTANVLPQQVAAFREAGMNDHIGKPFKRAALFAIIDRWVRDPAPQDVTGTLDLSTYREVAAVVGPERMRQLLVTLAKELAERFGTEDAPPEPEQLAHDAHAMISASGVLGFTAFALLCREVEQACGERRSYASALARLHAMRRDVMDEIALLRAA
jgi:PAS domain S-box-containing protein